MALKKAERKEKLVEIYKMLKIESANDTKLKEIREKLALVIARDTGLFILEDPIV